MVESQALTAGEVHLRDPALAGGHQVLGDLLG